MLWLPGGSSSFENQFISYDANLGSDKVCLGATNSLCVYNVTVSLITSYCNPFGGANDFALNEFFLDGTFGLSRTVWDGTSFISQAYN
jgi:hypothetical protein